ncbi:MAG: DUF58 domain-containing protein [Actinomycetota bacterium]
MNHQVSPRYVILLLVGVGGLLASVAAAMAQIAVLAAPVVAVVCLAAALHRRPDLDLELLAPERGVVGDRVELVVVARSRVGVPWLQLTIDLPPDLAAVDGVRRALVEVPADGEVEVRFPVELTRWGVATPGRLHATARDRFGMFVATTTRIPTTAIRVHPADGHRRSVIAPHRLRTRVGVHPSRHHGDGSEFADVRPFRPGDTMRAVNWRVTTRRGEPWVTVRHPDRSGDLVFLLDSFADLGPDGNRLVQRAVRATMGLAESSLAGHDRVGLLDVGRHLRWYRPRLGRLQRARLVDALLETQVEPGLRAPTPAQLPLHELTDGSLIVMLTGLTDPTLSTLPAQLRARGHEVAVLDCTPDGHLPAPPDEATELADRLWRLLRQERAEALRQAGVPVVAWPEGQPIEVPAVALARRRSGRR